MYDGEEASELEQKNEPSDVETVEVLWGCRCSTKRPDQTQNRVLPLRSRLSPRAFAAPPRASSIWCHVHGHVAAAGSQGSPSPPVPPASQASQGSQGNTRILAYQPAGLGQHSHKARQKDGRSLYAPSRRGHHRSCIFHVRLSLALSSLCFRSFEN
jgi:hypothetical protein